VLGVDQGKDALNTVSPARAGTWAMLGIYDLSIPRAHIATLLAVWGVQGLAFGLFAMVNYALIAIGLPHRTQTSDGVTHRLSDFAATQPLVAGSIAALLLILLVGIIVVGRRKIGQIRQQIAEGIAILGTPERYLRLIFLPSLAAYGARCAATVVLLAAFGIPVTVWTAALALGSHAAAGAVRITPGGIGTTQALEVVALRDYAAAEVVTAYTLADLALSALVSFGLAIPALLSASGWRGTRALVATAVSAPPVSPLPATGTQDPEHVP
jgi:glycosyltransferase 2 family protein